MIQGLSKNIDDIVAGPCYPWAWFIGICGCGLADLVLAMTLFSPWSRIVLFILVILADVVNEYKYFIHWLHW
jgi:hypothetical protein